MKSLIDINTSLNHWNFVLMKRTFDGFLPVVFIIGNRAINTSYHQETDYYRAFFFCAKKRGLGHRDRANVVFPLCHGLWGWIEIQMLGKFFVQSLFEFIKHKLFVRIQKTAYVNLMKGTILLFFYLKFMGKCGHKIDFSS